MQNLIIIICQFKAFYHLQPFRPSLFNPKNPLKILIFLPFHDPAPSSSGAFMVGLPPAWVDDSEEIGANVKRAKFKMAELVKAHSEVSMPSFGDVKDDQCAIEVLTKEITDLLRKYEKRLRYLSSFPSSEDSNLRKNVLCSLATERQSLSVNLRRRK